ncbi:DUF3298 and DUF4163 domain-containing protein [Anaerostipes sp.]|uniref:DUF3298 and DUF4163 domain-containing protein n=1 Tax=Anaerostipes sp. TaxID=1872530 RepID=UPI0025C4C71A|nr:DUF3298 and DUF4163 domain-containing protein [Anaerostipes sp.]MBS7009466.1 DUF3298 and DUF4163 domain-containing protein [Anaerostipes sp.]
MENKKKMDHLKQQYKEIKIPKELEQKVMDSIERGKAENEKARKKARFTSFGTKLGLSAAAALFVITVAANTNQNIAYAMAKVPVLKNIVKVVTFRSYEEKENNMEAKIKTPKVTGLKDKKTQKNINKELAQYTDMIKKEFAKDLSKNSKAHKSLTTDYKVLQNSDSFLSIQIRTETSEGSSDSYSRIYNIDKKTGKIIKLGSLFKKNAGYRSVISKEIRRQMRQQMRQDSSKSYFIDTKKDDVPAEDFKTISASQNFYLKPSGDLVIVFDKYEAAPGYMGTPEFTISKKLLSSILR